MRGIFIFSVLAQWILVGSVTTITYVWSHSNLTDWTSLWPTALALGLCILVEFVAMIVLCIIHGKVSNGRPLFGSGDCACGNCFLLGFGTEDCNMDGESCALVTIFIFGLGILFSSIINGILLDKIYESVTDPPAETFELEEC